MILKCVGCKRAIHIDTMFEVNGLTDNGTLQGVPGWTRIDCKCGRLYVFEYYEAKNVQISELKKGKFKGKKLEWAERKPKERPQ